MSQIENSVRWIGNHIKLETIGIPEFKNKLQLLFFEKCALNNLTIQLGSYVCVENNENIDPESYETCGIGKILHLYEDNSNKKPLKKAIVQWYSRKNDLIRCKKSINNPQVIEKLDCNYELVEDSRFERSIGIDSIFDIGQMFKTLAECQKAKKPKARFFCSYQLEKVSITTYRLVPLQLTIKLKRKIDDKLDLANSPHGTWMVKLDKISETLAEIPLSTIENGQTPKRRVSSRCRTPKTPKTPSGLSPVNENIMKRIFDDDSSDEKQKISSNKGKRKSLFKIEGESTPGTPTTRGTFVRGKSILKTPTVSQPKSQRRSIQFSGTIEELHFERKSENENPDDFSAISKRLHVSAVPKSLPCREKEFQEIYSFLEGNLKDEVSGCMYVSGVPGTGKTATTSGVIRLLKEEVENDNLPEFEYVEINGMKLTEPRQAYVEICLQLTGTRMSWEQAFNFLDKRFTTPSHRRVSTILMVDELDILCNKRQDVVYNLLNWPHQNSARLTVVTIANTMDLPERVFMGKIASRLGLTRLTFKPYSHKQLQEIVASRLVGLNSSFSSDAIQLVARKVASLSGDARRALDICRRASEIAANDLSSLREVTMTHVQEALNEMISCTKVKIIKSCSKMEKLFLQAVCMEIERTGIEEVIFRGVYNQLKILAAINGSQQPTFDTAMAISSALGACRILICEHPRKDIYQKILLNVSADDIYYATELRNKE